MEGGNIRHSGVYEFPVNLVAEEEEPVLLHYVAQALHLLSGVEVARRVVGVADEYGLGARGDLRLELLHGRKTETVLDSGLHALDYGSHGNRKGHIVGVERVGDYDFVARIEAGQEGEEYGFGTSGGDDDLIRGEVDAVFGVVLDHLRAQGEVAVGRAVLQNLPVHVLEGLQGAVRSLDVRLAYVEMVHFHSVPLCRVGIGS